MKLYLRDKFDVDYLKSRFETDMYNRDIEMLHPFIVRIAEDMQFDDLLDLCVTIEEGLKVSVRPLFKFRNRELMIMYFSDGTWSHITFYIINNDIVTYVG